MRIISIALALALNSGAAMAQIAPASPPSFTQQALDECQKTKQFLLYDGQQGIVDALQRLDDAQQGLKQERKISAASGVRNLAVEYEYGSRIVAARDLLADSWKQYRAAGGKAKSAKDLKAPGPTPCPDPSEQLPH